MGNPIPSRETMVNYIYGGPPGAPAWVIQVTNDPSGYLFVGDTAREQLLNVDILSSLMKVYADDLPGLAGELGTVIQIPPEETAEAVMNTLFGTSQELWFTGQRIAVAPDGDVLIDALEAAGEALEKAVAALVGMFL